LNVTNLKITPELRDMFEGTLVHSFGQAWTSYVVQRCEASFQLPFYPDSVLLAAHKVSFVAANCKRRVRF
jgi:hypothetical protein